MWVRLPPRAPFFPPGFESVDVSPFAVYPPRNFCFDKDIVSTAGVYEVEGLRVRCGTKKICFQRDSLVACWGLARIEATSPQAAAKDNQNPGIARLPVRSMREELTAGAKQTKR